MDLHRLPSSRNGNPRFLVELATDAGYMTLRTLPDSHIGYVVENHWDQEVRVAYRRLWGITKSPA